MPDRIIGILGGMGPEATADLFREITRATPAEVDQDHVRVLIYSNPKIPDRTRAILGNGEDPLPALVASAKVLEKAGAGIIAVPCNAAHFFLSQVQAEVRVPILNMILETFRTLRASLPGIRSIGLLAATGTIRSGVYSTVLAAEGVDTIAPDAEDQSRVHGAILQIKSGKHDHAISVTLHSVGARLIAAGAEAVILGCTEIPIAFNPNAVDYLSLNPTRVLAHAAVDWALGKRQ
jgi:aspartate racemase